MDTACCACRESYTELPMGCVGQGDDEEEGNRALSLSSVGGL